MKYKFLKYKFYLVTIILFLTAIGSLMKKEYHHMWNSIFIFFCYLVWIYIKNRGKIYVREYIEILVIITVLLHNVFGQYFNLYMTTEWFDKALHVFGTFSFALFFYSIIDIITNIADKPKMFTFIIISSIGISSAAILESVEFILDTIFKVKNQHGLTDINLDLIFNLIGGVLAGIFGAFAKNEPLI